MEDEKILFEKGNSRISPFNKKIPGVKNRCSLWYTLFLIFICNAINAQTITITVKDINSNSVSLNSLQ
jgi:hypothetical protein